jgi:hypothetical protein
MRDDWFHLEIQRQAHDAAEPVAGRGDPGLILGIALIAVAAALIVLAPSLLF